MRIPKGAPALGELLQARLSDKAGGFLDLLIASETKEFVRSVNDRYLHWDKFRFQPLPEGLDQETAWLAVQMSRSSQLQQLPLSFFQLGDRLKYWIPPQH